MRSTVTTVLAVLALAGGAIHGKLDHDKALGRHSKDHDTDPSKDQGGAKSDKPKADVPDISPQLKSIQELIEAGDFEDAEGQIKQLLDNPELGAQNYAHAQNARQELALVRSLTSIVPEHPFANGAQLFAVKLPSGNTVVAKVLSAPKAERLSLLLQDGRQLGVARKRIQKLEALGQNDFQKILDGELKARKKELGKDPNPVEIYRTIVTYCLEYKMRKRAITALRGALSQPSGGVLIDLFCEQASHGFHRAQARMSGVTDLAMLDQIERNAKLKPSRIPDSPDEQANTNDQPNNEPKPEPQPEPQNTPETGPNTEPQKTPEDKPVVARKPKSKKKNLNVLNEPLWKEADLIYRSGIREYRSSMRGSAKRVAAAIKKSRALFEKAQQKLEPLWEGKYEDDPTLERRLVELSQLIYDCVKREKI